MYKETARHVWALLEDFIVVPLYEPFLYCLAILRSLMT
jgi:hypothetical protein